jgi:hypothetical protein
MALKGSSGTFTESLESDGGQGPVRRGVVLGADAAEQTKMACPAQGDEVSAADWKRAIEAALLRQQCDLPRVQPGAVDLSRRHRVKPAKGMQQCRFAGAIRARDGGQGTGREGSGQIAQHVAPAAAQGDAVKAERWRDHDKAQITASHTKPKTAPATSSRVAAPLVEDRGWVENNLIMVTI